MKGYEIDGYQAYLETIAHMEEAMIGVDMVCEAHFREGQKVLYKKLKKSIKDKKSLKILKKVMKGEKKRLKR